MRISDLSSDVCSSDLALGRHDRRYDVAVVSNVDGAALSDAIAKFSPEHTLVAVASKTFTTTETLPNAAAALQWLAEAGVEDTHGVCIALTDNPDTEVEWGDDGTSREGSLVGKEV